MESMMRHNREFVESGKWKDFETSKYPDKKTAIVTCMDTRLVGLLPAALGIRNGDIKMIKNAGGLIVDPYSDSMRALLVAIYELGVDTVMIVAHTACGVEGMKGSHFIEMMKQRGIPENVIDKIQSSGVDLEAWLTGFEDTDDAVRKSVALVSSHPLLPKDITVKGYIIDTLTGQLREVI